MVIFVFFQYQLVFSRGNKQISAMDENDLLNQFRSHLRGTMKERFFSEPFHSFCYDVSAESSLNSTMSNEMLLIFLRAGKHDMNKACTLVKVFHCHCCPYQFNFSFWYQDEELSCTGQELSSVPEHSDINSYQAIPWFDDWLLFTGSQPKRPEVYRFCIKIRWVRVQFLRDGPASVWDSFNT